MMYFSPQHHILTVMQADPAVWGLIATRRRGAQPILAGYRWLADNGCFTQVWSEGKWLRWLDDMTEYQDRCLMVTLPDVVGDAAQTLERFYHYLPMIRQRGWRVGLVAQDGMEGLPFPPDYDALFIGGTTAWKMSDGADCCLRQAQAAGKWTHVGRVNSATRIRHFQLRDVDSVDGTTICYAPFERFENLNQALTTSPQ